MNKPSGQETRPPKTKTKAGGIAPPRTPRAPASDVGTALRSAYQRTLQEDIPPEMLDLLGKLD